MRDSTQLVPEFHRAAGNSDPTIPTPPDKNLARLRLRLIREEYKEVRIELETLINHGHRMDLPAQLEVLKRLAKELADLRYVVEGTFAACGLDSLAIYEEVHRSNMSKFDGGLTDQRDDGKVLKGSHYRPPDMDAVVPGIIEGREP